MSTIRGIVSHIRKQCNILKYLPHMVCSREIHVSRSKVENTQIQTIDTKEYKDFKNISQYSEHQQKFLRKETQGTRDILELVQRYLEAGKKLEAYEELLKTLQPYFNSVFNHQRKIPTRITPQEYEKYYIQIPYLQETQLQIPLHDRYSISKKYIYDINDISTTFEILCNDGFISLLLKRDTNDDNYIYDTLQIAQIRIDMLYTMFTRITSIHPWETTQSLIWLLNEMKMVYIYLNTLYKDEYTHILKICKDIENDYTIYLYNDNEQYSQILKNIKEIIDVGPHIFIISFYINKILHIIHSLISSFIGVLKVCSQGIIPDCSEWGTTKFVSHGSVLSDFNSNTTDTIDTVLKEQDIDSTLYESLNSVKNVFNLYTILSNEIDQNTQNTYNNIIQCCIIQQYYSCISIMEIQNRTCYNILSFGKYYKNTQFKSLEHFLRLNDTNLDNGQYLGCINSYMSSIITSCESIIDSVVYVINVLQYRTNNSTNNTIYMKNDINFFACLIHHIVNTSEISIQIMYKSYILLQNSKYIVPELNDEYISRQEEILTRLPWSRKSSIQTKRWFPKDGKNRCYTDKVIVQTNYFIKEYNECIEICTSYIFNDIFIRLYILHIRMCSLTTIYGKNAVAKSLNGAHTWYNNLLNMVYNDDNIISNDIFILKKPLIEFYKNFYGQYIDSTKTNLQNLNTVPSITRSVLGYFIEYNNLYTDEYIQQSYQRVESFISQICLHLRDIKLIKILQSNLLAVYNLITLSKELYILGDKNLSYKLAKLSGETVLYLYTDRRIVRGCFQDISLDTTRSNIASLIFQSSILASSGFNDIGMYKLKDYLQQKDIDQDTLDTYITQSQESFNRSLLLKIIIFYIQEYIPQLPNDIPGADTLNTIREYRIKKNPAILLFTAAAAAAAAAATTENTNINTDTNNSSKQNTIKQQDYDISPSLLSSDIEETIDTMLPTLHDAYKYWTKPENVNILINNLPLQQHIDERIPISNPFRIIYYKFEYPQAIISLVNSHQNIGQSYLFISNYIKAKQHFILANNLLQMFMEYYNTNRYVNFNCTQDIKELLYLHSSLYANLGRTEMLCYQQNISIEVPKKNPQLKVSSLYSSFLNKFSNVADSVDTTTNELQNSLQYYYNSYNLQIDYLRPIDKNTNIIIDILLPSKPRLNYICFFWETCQPKHQQQLLEICRNISICLVLLKDTKNAISFLDDVLGIMVLCMYTEECSKLQDLYSSNSSINTIPINLPRTPYLTEILYIKACALYDSNRQDEAITTLKNCFWHAYIPKKDIDNTTNNSINEILDYNTINYEEKFSINYTINPQVQKKIINAAAVLLSHIFYQKGQIKESLHCLSHFSVQGCDDDNFKFI